MTIRTYILIAFVVSFCLGMFMGVKCLAPALTQHHYTEKIIEKPVIVEGETKTVTETQIAYIPKEIVKYIDPKTGQEISQAEKTDIDAQIGKQEINIKLNSQEISFKKLENEQFVFEKNKIALNQSSTVTFDIQVKPPIIDKTKKWSIGIGYSSNGLAGKIDFPIGNERFGGWIYSDKKMGLWGQALSFK